MSHTTVVFDGQELTLDYWASNLSDPLLPRDVATQEVPGRDGTAFTGVTLSERVISMQLTAIGGSYPDRVAAARRLAAILATRQERPLMLNAGEDGTYLYQRDGECLVACSTTGAAVSGTDLAASGSVSGERLSLVGDLGDVYYMAVPRSDADPEAHLNAKTWAVDFVCPDPVAFGAWRSVTVPSGGSVEFEVGGTYRTDAGVSAAGATRDAATGVWGIRLDDGDFLHVALSDGAHAVEIDGAERTGSVDGAVRLPSFDSDWFVLEPGRHVIANDLGRGSCTISWVERWL